MWQETFIKSEKKIIKNSATIIAITCQNALNLYSGHLWTHQSEHWVHCVHRVSSGTRRLRWLECWIPILGEYSIKSLSDLCPLRPRPRSRPVAVHAVESWTTISRADSRNLATGNPVTALSGGIVRSVPVVLMGKERWLRCSGSLSAGRQYSLNQVVWIAAISSILLMICRLSTF